MYRFKSVLAALAVAVTFGVTAPAHASYSYTIFDDGVAQTALVTPVGNNFVTSLSTTHFQITIASSFTTPNQLGTVLNTNLQGQLDVGVTGTHTIKIELNYNNYVLPVGTPLLANNAASATFTNSPSTNGQATFQAWGSTANSSSFETGTTAGQMSVGSPVGTATGLVLGPTPNSFLFTNTGSYSLSQTLSLKLDGGTTGPGTAAGQVQGTTTVTVPAPAGLVLALTGLPVLGGFGWLRRRNSAALAA